jgi:hypothetical protein
MEIVSRGENTLRGESPFAQNKRKTHCPRGHEYSHDNTYLYKGTRSCRQCHNELKRERRRSLSKHLCSAPPKS